jgi:hypothetical protein
MKRVQEEKERVEAERKAKEEGERKKREELERVRVERENEEKVGKEERERREKDAKGGLGGLDGKGKEFGEWVGKMKVRFLLSPSTVRSNPHESCSGKSRLTSSA